MSERSGGRQRSEQSGASKRVSGASERANGRASDPVLTSQFLFVPDHSASTPVWMTTPTSTPVLITTPSTPPGSPDLSDRFSSLGKEDGDRDRGENGETETSPPLHYGTKPGHFVTSNLTLSHKRGSERSGERERSEQSEASERVSGVTERANGRLYSFFVPDHSGLGDQKKKMEIE